MSTKSLHDYLIEINGLLEESQSNEALAHCRHILQQLPRHIGTYRAMAQALLDKGEYVDAIDLFQRVLSTDPGDFVAHLGLAVIYEEQDALSQSIWHMERAYEMKPYDPVIQNKLRDLLIKRDSSVAPRIALTQGALARIYLRGELYQQAVLELRKALRDDEDRIDLEVVLAETLWRDSRRVEAAELCRSILQRLPNCIQANAILAEIWFQAGRGEEANEHLKRIQEMIQLDVEHCDIETAVGRAFMADGTQLLPDRVEVEYLDDTYEGTSAVAGATGWGAESAFPEEEQGEGTFSWLREDVFGEEAEVSEPSAASAPGVGAPSTESIWLVDDAVETADEAPDKTADSAELPDWLMDSDEPVTEPELADEAVAESTWFAASEGGFSAEELASADDSDWLSMLDLTDDESEESVDEPELFDFAAEEEDAEELPWMLADDESEEEAALDVHLEEDVFEDDASLEVLVGEADEGAAPEEIPDWLSSGGLDVDLEDDADDLQADVLGGPEATLDDLEDSGESLPDWLMGDHDDATLEAGTEELLESPADLSRQAPSDYPEMPSLDASPGDDLPDWLRSESFDTSEGTDAVDEAMESLGLESPLPSEEVIDLPDWLQEAGDAVEPAGVEPADAPETPSEIPVEVESEGEALPDWLQDEQFDTMLGLQVVDDASESVGLTTEVFSQDESDLLDRLTGLEEPAEQEGDEPTDVIEEVSAEAEEVELPDWLQDEQHDTFVGLKAVDDAGESVGLTTHVLSRGDIEGLEPPSEAEPPESAARAEATAELPDAGEVPEDEEQPMAVEELEEESAFMDEPPAMPSIGVSDEEELPAWLDQERYDTAAGIEVVEQAVESLGLSPEILAQGEADIPDWLRDTDDEDIEAGDEQPGAPEEVDDIFSAGEEEVEESPGVVMETFSQVESDIPEWLQEADEGPDQERDAAPEPVEEDDVPSTGVEDEEIPSWLRDEKFDTEQAVDVADQARESLGISTGPFSRAEADIPDWLQVDQEYGGAEAAEAGELPIDEVPWPDDAVDEEPESEEMELTSPDDWAEATGMDLESLAEVDALLGLDGPDDAEEIAADDAFLAESGLLESPGELDISEPAAQIGKSVVDPLADLEWLTETADEEESQEELQEGLQEEPLAEAELDELTDEMPEDEEIEVAETTGWLATLASEPGLSEGEPSEPESELSFEDVIPATEPDKDLDESPTEDAADVGQEPDEMSEEQAHQWSDAISATDDDADDWLSGLSDDEEQEEPPVLDEIPDPEEGADEVADWDAVHGVDVDMEMAIGLDLEDSSDEAYDDEIDAKPDADEDLDWLAELTDDEEVDEFDDQEWIQDQDEEPEEEPEPELETLRPSEMEAPESESADEPVEDVAVDDLEWLTELADGDELEPEEQPDREALPEEVEEPEGEVEAELAAVTEPELEVPEPESADELVEDVVDEAEDLEWLTELADEEEPEPEEQPELEELPEEMEAPDLELEADLAALTEAELEVPEPESADELVEDVVDEAEDLDWLTELADEEEPEPEEQPDREAVPEEVEAPDLELAAELAGVAEQELAVPAPESTDELIQALGDETEDLDWLEELPGEEDFEVDDSFDVDELLSLDEDPEEEPDEEPTELGELDMETAVAEVGLESAADEAPDVPEDLDDAMAWLEQLAADQGAPVEELPTVAEVTEPREEELLGDEPEADAEQAVEDEIGVAEVDSELDMAPQDPDDAMAWLERLAARQGAPAEELPSVEDEVEPVADEKAMSPELSDELAKALDWLEQTAIDSEPLVTDETEVSQAIEVADEDLEAALDQLEHLALTRDASPEGDDFSAVSAMVADESEGAEEDVLETFFEEPADVDEAPVEEQEELDDSLPWLEDLDHEDEDEPETAEPEDDAEEMTADDDSTMPSEPAADLEDDEQESYTDELMIRPTFGADDDALFTPSVDLSEGVLEDGFLEDVPDDPEAALEWLEQFVDDDEEQEDLADAEAEISEAIGFEDLVVEEEAPSPDVRQLTSDLLEEFGDELDAEFLEQIPDDPDQAIAWLQQFVDEDEIPDVSDEWEEAAPTDEALSVAGPDIDEEMADIVEDQFDDEEAGDDLLDDMPDDPDAAMAWLQDLAEQQDVITEDTGELLEEALTTRLSDEDDMLGEALLDVDELEDVIGEASIDEVPEALREGSTDELPEWLELESEDEDELDEDDVWLETESEPNVAAWLEDEATVSGVFDVEAEIARAEQDFGTGPLDPSVVEADEDELRLPDTGRLAHSVVDLDESELTLARQTLRVKDYEDAIQSYQTLVEKGEGISTLISDLEDASEEHAEQPLIRRLLGDAYMRNGQLQKALDNYRQALDLM